MPSAEHVTAQRINELIVVVISMGAGFFFFIIGHVAFMCLFTICVRSDGSSADSQCAGVSPSTQLILAAQPGLIDPVAPLV